MSEGEKKGMNKRDREREKEGKRISEREVENRG